MSLNSIPCFAFYIFWMSFCSLLKFACIVKGTVFKVSVMLIDKGSHFIRRFDCISRQSFSRCNKIKLHFTYYIIHRQNM